MHTATSSGTVLAAEEEENQSTGGAGRGGAGRENGFNPELLLMASSSIYWPLSCGVKSGGCIRTDLALL